ncbi:MAG: intermembrane phospholipid transport protein YdbH family protein, partial [Magnetospiraceae bacterium]
VLTPQAVRIAGEVAVTAPEDLILKPVGMEPITLPAKDLRLSIAATADRTTGDTSLTAEVSPLSLRQPGWDIADGGITVDVAHGAEKSQTQIRLRDLRVAQTGQQKLVVPLVVSGDMDMDNALVKFTGRAVGANGRLDLRLKGNHAIAENTGEIHFEMRPLTVGKGGAKATDIFPILLGSAHIAQGTAAVDGTARWSEKGLRADATLDLTNWVMRLSPRATGIDGGVRLAGENISLTARGRPGKRGMATSGNVILKKVSLEALETIASGVNGKITLSSLWPLATPKGQKITIDEVDVGLPLTDGHVIFQAGRNASFTLEQARLGLFSGDVTVSDISFAPGKPIPPINLRVTGVDLAQLLALVESQEVEGTGLLDGILPLTVKDGDIAITDGRLVAREEGTFRYVPPAAGPNEATDMVADALSDLRYNQLTMTVNGTAGGDMAMLLNLKGHNPNFLGGHPVDLNFKIEGELLGLARQGARGFGLPADALRGLGRQK